MPSVVAQYSHTYIGQALENTFKFYMPMLTKLRDSNYWEIEVTQIGLRRPGVSTPHDIIFCMADIQGAQSQVVTDKGQIDSRVNLGMVTVYDSGSVPAHLTSPAPITFRLNTLQPGNPFTVTLFRLGSQELANQFVFTETQPSVLQPIGEHVNAQFECVIDDGAGGSGTILDVIEMYSPTNSLAIGQIIRAEGVAQTSITALGTGTGGVGTYTVANSRFTGITGVAALSISPDTSSNCQMIMNWTIKEMTPYEMPRGEIVKY